MELKTEFELEQVISMQLRNRITVVRNVRIHHLSLLKARHETQLFSAGLEIADGMIKTTLKLLGSDSTSFR